MTAYTAPRAPQARPQAAPLDPERAAFYAALWGDAEGYVQIAAGLPASDILARGWPLANDERPRDPAELDDTMLMLLWTGATGDAFKAAGRPHTGKVFHWPSEARALDRYVEKMAREFDNVYCRKYFAETIEDAKKGRAPRVARVVQVEDAPAELPGDLPAFSFTLQTSGYSRQGFYVLPRALPWHQVERIAEGLATRLKPLGADSGGPNPAQYTRVPTTRNTKGRAGRFRVRLVEGAGSVDLGALAAAALPGGLADLRGGGQPSDNSQLSGGRRAPGDLAGDAEREPWRSRSTRDALDAEAAVWRPLVRTGPGGLLADTGAPRAFKAGSKAWENWTGGGTGDGSIDVYQVHKSLLYHGYTDGQALALAEHFAHHRRPAYVQRRGAAQVWVDLCRVHFKLCAELGDRRRVRDAQPPAGVQPQAGPEATRAPRGKGRPAGARAEQVERLGELLAAREGERVTRGELAAGLGVGVRAVACYLATLRAAPVWDVQLRALRRGGLLVERCARNEDRKSAREVRIAPSEMRIAPEASPHQEAPEGVAAALGEHTPPDPAPCPAPPAAAAAPWGDDDRALLVAELLAAGHAMRAYTLAWGFEDEARRDRALRRLRPLVEAEAQALERRALDVLAAELVTAALAQVEPQPAPAAPRRPAPRELPGLVAEALDTLGTRLYDPETGEALPRARVDADLVRAWLARRAPGLDTSRLEEVLPRVKAARRYSRADEALRRKVEKMSPGRRLGKLRNLERAMVSDLRTAAELRQQPYRLDPITGAITAERRSDKEPWQFEARAKVWARQYAIVARVHEGRALSALEEEAEEEAMRRLADAAFTEARRKAAEGPPPPVCRPRVNLAERRPQVEQPAPPVAAAAPARGVSSPCPEPAPVEPHQWGSTERATLAERLAALKLGKVAACAD